MKTRPVVALVATLAVAALLATAGHAATAATPCQDVTSHEVAKKPKARSAKPPSGPPYAYDSKGQCHDRAGAPVSQSYCPKPPLKH